MPQFRRLSAMVAMVAVLTLAFSSVASAHWGPWHRLMRFDNVWIDTSGVDLFTAKDGDRDKILGLGGNDELDAGDMNDLVRGGVGDDTIDGGDGHDILIGGPGDDTMNGGDGHDILIGGLGNDTIDGGDGHDILIGGLGDDIIYAADRRRDWVRCGPGDDQYTADRFDRVAVNCETDITEAEVTS